MFTCDLDALLVVLLDGPVRQRRGKEGEDLEGGFPDTGGRHFRFAGRGGGEGKKKVTRAEENGSRKNIARLSPRQWAPGRAWGTPEGRPFLLTFLRSNTVKVKYVTDRRRGKTSVRGCLHVARVAKEEPPCGQPNGPNQLF